MMSASGAAAVISAHALSTWRPQPSRPSDTMLHAREDHGLIVVRDDVRALGHERDPAEDHVLGVGLGRLLRELVGVTDEVGVLDDLPSLIVVPQDDDIVAEFLERRIDAFGPFVFPELPVPRWELLEVVVFEQTQIGVQLRRFHFDHLTSPVAVRTSVAVIE